MSKNKEKDLERYKAEQAHRIELIRATIAFEHAALKPTFLLNGGALVVVFAFLGAIWKQTGEFCGIALMIWALGCWSCGLFIAATAAALGYKSQFAFRKARERKLDAEHAADAKNDEEVRKKNRAMEVEGDLGQKYRAWGERAIFVSLLLFLSGVILGVVALAESV